MSSLTTATDTRERATNDEKEARIQEAVEMLSVGMGKAQVALRLKETHGISLRQAQRYAKKVAIEMLADPMSTESLDTEFALDMHRLDVIADQALSAGTASGKNVAIQAIKAKAGIANQRLKAMETLPYRQRNLEMPF